MMRMMDGEEFIQRIKHNLMSTWKNNGRITIPVKSLENADIKSLTMGISELPILAIEIPLIVGEDGFRIAFDIDKEEE